MRHLRRLLQWAGVAVAIALLFLAAGQMSSAISPLQVLRVEGIALGDYHGAATHLAPLSKQAIADANRDALTTPTPIGGASTPEPGPVGASAEPLTGSPTPSGQPQPSPTPTPTATPTASPLPSAIATTAPPGSITGTVQDSQTAVGIANALVSLGPGGLSTLTSSNGAFGFPVVPAGTYTITASASGYWAASASVTVTAGHNTNLNLHLVSTGAGGSVQGLVKSSATGKAAAGAVVTLTPGSKATVTDSTGYYGFASVPAGTYTLTVTATGYQPYSLVIAVKSAHTTQVNVSLTPV